MTEPIRLTFEIDAPPAEAFDTWTAGISTWWPRDHTVSGDEVDLIRFEGHAGGRLYERTADGREFDWGLVTEWSPPSRVAYLWHLGATLDDATDVVVTFTETDDGTTSVELVHDGWDRLGAAATGRRHQNQAGWDSILSAYVNIGKGELT